MEYAIMIEGQNGLNWARWQSIALLAEELGFDGIYRSDHYTNANPPDKDSLELWISLAWLAEATELIEFGPLVSPVSFRHPTMTARMAAAVDDLSAGRLVLGLGAGWQEREHNNYGWDLLDIGPRFDRFEEGLEVITHLLKSDEPVDFEGDYYQLQDAVLLPRPERPHGPPILIGGNGPQKTLPLVAKYADEWNAVFIPPETIKERMARLDMLLEENGRQPKDVRRSLMTGCIFGYDAAAVKRKLETRGTTAEAQRARGAVVGTGAQLRDQIEEIEEVGIQRIMLQWLDLDDTEGLAALAHALL